MKKCIIVVALAVVAFAAVGHYLIAQVDLSIVWEPSRTTVACCFASGEGGIVIRVSPLSAAEGNLRQIQFGVSFQDQGSGLEFYEYSPDDKQDEIEISAGQIVILSLWARISSPSEVDSVFIQDKTDNWERSKTPIMSTAWQQYVVARVIRDEATGAMIGVH